MRVISWGERQRPADGENQSIENSFSRARSIVARCRALKSIFNVETLPRSIRFHQGIA